MQLSSSNAIPKELQAQVPKQSRRVRRRTRSAAKAKARSDSIRTKAYKAAHLDTGGLLSYSQRNRAKALALIEPVPDIIRLSYSTHKRGIVFGLHVVTDEGGRRFIKDVINEESTLREG